MHYQFACTTFGNFYDRLALVEIIMAHGAICSHAQVDVESACLASLMHTRHATTNALNGAGQLFPGRTQPFL